MEAILIGMVVGFICSVGFLALGYTLGSNSQSQDVEKNIKNRNELIDEIIDWLRELKNKEEETKNGDNIPHLGEEITYY